MNHKLLFGILILISLSLMSSNCTSDDDANSRSNITELNNLVANGPWKISKFNDSKDDETYHFKGYEFTFLPDGNIKAVKEDNTITGSWSITSNGNSTDNKDYSDVEFNIFFASPPSFNDLTDNWDIRTLNGAKFDLMHVRGKGDPDFLEFSKN